MSANGLDRREIAAAAVSAGALHALVAGAAIVAGIKGTYAWNDQVDYHLPTINTMAAEFPAPVLSDYQSATSPGYHLVMALLVRAGAGDLALHFVNASIGIVFVALFAALVARFMGGLAGLLAGATLALSPYTVNPSVFLATDNLANALILGAFLCALPIASGCARLPVRNGAVAALFAMLAVGVRQISIYASAFVGAAFVARGCAERRWPRVPQLAAGALAILPAVALVGVLVVTWGGLVPPSFQGYHGSGGNPATPVYALALVSIWGGAAFLAIPGFLRELLSARVVAAGVLAGIACCLVPSSYLVHVRFGGTLWTIASKFPAIADRSLLLVPMAAIGAAVLAAYLRIWARSSDTAADGIRARGIGAFALLAFVGLVFTQTANSQCFERYLQPLTVVFMTVAAAAMAGRAARWWPFAVAACVSAVWTALSLLKGGS